MNAEEGDLRLLEEESVTNWVTGELQIFFEGSWSQVCATNFDDRDAAVACRQLGYSAGSVAADFEFRPGQEATDAVDAEVAITNSGCNGREDSLLDCEGQNMLRRTTSRECQSSRSFPLRLACVVDEIPGAFCLHGSAAVQLPALAGTWMWWDTHQEPVHGER